MDSCAPEYLGLADIRRGRLEKSRPIKHKVSHAKKKGVGGGGQNKKSESILDIKEYRTAKVW